MIPNLALQGGASAPSFADNSGGVKISPVIISKNSFIPILVGGLIGVVLWKLLKK